MRLEASGRQRLWMVPSLKLVILRVGDEPPASEGWDEAMIPDSIIRGTRDWRPASTGEGSEVDSSPTAIPLTYDPNGTAAALVARAGRPLQGARRRQRSAARSRSSAWAEAMAILRW